MRLSFLGCGSCTPLCVRHGRCVRGRRGARGNKVLSEWCERNQEANRSRKLRNVSSMLPTKRVQGSDALTGIVPSAYTELRIQTKKQHAGVCNTKTHTVQHDHTTPFLANANPT